MRTYKTPKAILKHAAKLIEERGWTKWQMIDAGGSLCAVGAIRMAAAGRTDRGTKEARAAQKCFERGLEKHGAVGWNDVVASSKSQVIKALLKASEAA